jgi:hypothetical protein
VYVVYSELSILMLIMLLVIICTVHAVLLLLDHLFLRCPFSIKIVIVIDIVVCAVLVSFLVFPITPVC